MKTPAKHTSKKNASRDPKSHRHSHKQQAPQNSKPHKQTRKWHTAKQRTASGCYFCPQAKQCGACPEITVPYPEQLKRKHAYLNDLFAELYTPQTRVYAIAGMDNPTHYRNKVISPFAPAKHSHKKSQNKQSKQRGSTSTQSEILTGMYARGTHRLITTDGCLVENETANKIVQVIRAIMTKYHMEPYNEDTGEGFMRHVVVRIGHTSNEVLVTLVTNKDEFKGAKNFCRELVARVPKITTIVQNVNTRQTNVILGDGIERTLYGPGFILDSLCGVSFRISSHSFYQVNAIQTEVLYERALEMAHLTPGDTIIDAYCGTGTIGLAAAAHLERKEANSEVNSETDSDIQTASQTRVLGVDSVASAIHDARENAAHNGITSAEFVCADAGDYLRDLAQHNESVDVVFMDPPRSGSSKEFLEALITLQPKRVVYISCNPKTQQRDARMLCDAGYVITEAQGVDMFPHTNHIEHINTFERR